MGDVERETGLDLSGPAPEDPMEPFYFDRRAFHDIFSYCNNPDSIRILQLGVLSSRCPRDWPSKISLETTAALPLYRKHWRVGRLLLSKRNGWQRLHRQQLTPTRLKASTPNSAVC